MFSSMPDFNSLRTTVFNFFHKKEEKVGPNISPDPVTPEEDTQEHEEIHPLNKVASIPATHIAMLRENHYLACKKATDAKNEEMTIEIYAENFASLSRIDNIHKSSKFSLSTDKSLLVCQHTDLVLRAWSLKDYKNPICVSELKTENKVLKKIVSLSKERFAFIVETTISGKDEEILEQKQTNAITLWKVNPEEPCVNHLTVNRLKDIETLLAFPQKNLLIATDGDVSCLYNLNSLQLMKTVTTYTDFSNFFTSPDELGFVYTSDKRKVIFCKLNSAKITLHELNLGRQDLEIAGFLSTGELVTRSWALKNRKIEFTNKIWNLENLDQPRHVLTVTAPDSRKLIPLDNHRFAYAVSNSIDIFDLKSLKPYQDYVETEANYFKQSNQYLLDVMHHLPTDLIDIITDYTSNRYSIYNAKQTTATPVCTKTQDKLEKREILRL